MKKDKRGISLIVLVITIILMIILGATVILSLSGENTIKRAREAKAVSDLSSIVERVKLVIAQKQLEGINMAEGEYTLSDFGIESEYSRYIVVKDGQVYIRTTSPESIIEYAKKVNIKGIRILPKEYTEVEYLETTGTQYIDSIYFPSEFRYEIECELTYDSQYYNIFDSVANSGGSTTMLWVVEGKLEANIYNKLNVDINKKIKVFYDTLQENGTYGYYINGECKSSSFEKKTITTLIELFNRRKGECFKGKIYEILIYDSNKVVKDFVPCYCNVEVTDVNGKKCDPDTEGLYDLVEGKFYTNQGEGTFVLPTE